MKIKIHWQFSESLPTVTGRFPSHFPHFPKPPFSFWQKKLPMSHSLQLGSVALHTPAQRYLCWARNSKVMFSENSADVDNGAHPTAAKVDMTPAFNPSSDSHSTAPSSLCVSPQVQTLTWKELPTSSLSTRPRTSHSAKRFTPTWPVPQIPTISSLSLTQSLMSS